MPCTREHRLAIEAATPLEVVRAEVSYDPETGVFTRLTGQCAGEVVKTVQSAGYRQVRIRGHKFTGGRVAWMLTHGYWPQLPVRHRNGVLFDDRIKNLTLGDRWGCE